MTAVHITFEIYYFNDFVFDLDLFESFAIYWEELGWLTSSSAS